eukprot:5766223-Prymnesium_polylepis.2
MAVPRATARDCRLRRRSPLGAVAVVGRRRARASGGELEGVRRLVGRAEEHREEDTRSRQRQAVRLLRARGMAAAPPARIGAVSAGGHDSSKGRSTGEGPLHSEWECGGATQSA